MPTISVLIKPASGMCNMQCDYCFYCDEMKKRSQDSYGFMSEQTLKNVIRKTMIHAEGLISYVYQGGEPTLRGLTFFEKAVEYQRHYNKHGIRVNNALQTNGYLLDDAWCKFFKENQFLIGLSIDGTKQLHDMYRHDKNGNPTFDRIKSAADLMDQYGVDYNILTVVTQNAAYHATEIYNYYKRQGWKYQQYIACLDPVGEIRGKSSFALKPEQYGRFLVELFNLWYEDWKNGEHPYIRQFENYIGILLGYQPESCEQRGICGIQNVVEADGSVYPCDFYMLDEYRLGNFNSDRLVEIDEKRKSIAFVEQSQKSAKDCIECKFHTLCRGGCRRNREFDVAKGEYANYYCESYRFFFEQCLEKMIHIVETIKR